MNYSIFDLDYDRNIIRAGAYPEENLETKNAFTEGVAPGLVGPIGGKYLPDIGELAWLNESDIEIEDIINDRIDTQQAYIKSNWTFTESGAFVVKTDDDNGMWFSPTGILAKKSGNTTLTITNEGDATFAGTLSAASGTLGTITLTSGGNIKLGQTAYKIGTGFWLGDDDGTTKLSIGSSTKNITWDGSNLNVVGGTITGGIIQTAASGKRIVITGADNTLIFYDVDGQTVGIGSETASAIRIDATETTNNGIKVLSGQGGIGYYYSNESDENNIGLDIQMGYGLGPDNDSPSIRIESGGAGELLYGRLSGSGNGIVLVRSIGSGTASLLKIISSGGGVGGNTTEIIRSGSGNITAIDINHATSTTSNNYGIRMSLSSGNSSLCYAFRLDGSEVVSASVGGTQNKKIRVNIGGTDYYIPLYTA